MNILVSNGSPKKEKSDTMYITRAFVDGMLETAHHNIQTIHVIDRHIEFCQHTVQTADFAGISFEKSEKSLDSPLKGRCYNPPCQEKQGGFLRWRRPSALSCINVPSLLIESFKL